MFVIGDANIPFRLVGRQFYDNAELPCALIPRAAALFDGYFVIGNRSDDARSQFDSRRYILRFPLPRSSFR